MSAPNKAAERWERQQNGGNAQSVPTGVATVRAFIAEKLVRDPFIVNECQWVMPEPTLDGTQEQGGTTGSMPRSHETTPVGRAS